MMSRRVQRGLSESSIPFPRWNIASRPYLMFVHGPGPGSALVLRFIFPGLVSDFFRVPFTATRADLSSGSSFPETDPVEGDMSRR
jgi:hypothetical protein